jgi:hypothetical protein
LVIFTAALTYLDDMAMVVQEPSLRSSHADD